MSADWRVKIDPAYFEKLLSEPNAIYAVGTLESLWGARASISSDGELVGLSDVERNVSVALTYFGEVGNGGHDQYFFNAYPGHIRRAQEALSASGLVEAEAIFATALSRLPPGFAELARDEREIALDAVRDSGRGFEDLDFFLGNIRCWYEQLQAYVRAHREDVLKPERA